MKLVCVIIPMYNFNKMTKDCVELVKKNAGIDVDILVVDDGSKFPYGDDSINVLRLDENSGFTNAVNQGILWCSDKYKYIHLLNNDTVPQKNFIVELLPYIDDYAILSSVRIRDNSFLEYYGADLIRGHQHVSIDDGGRKIIDCVWVPFCSVMIKTSTIRYLGLLDVRMRNNCSDNDYCLRAITNGFKIGVVTESVVAHYHETTIKTLDKPSQDDQNIWVQKLVGLEYKKIMVDMPLDIESNTWGVLDFTVKQKVVDEKSTNN